MANNFQKLSASALAAALLVVAVPAADADSRVITGNDRGLRAEQVETQREQTLQIQKLPRGPYDKPDPDSKPDGGIEGLTFRLSKVKGVDATSQAGRDEAQDFDVSRAREKGFSDEREQVTNARGIAVFNHLGPGLYLIEEFAPNEEHDWRLSSPKLVLLPLGDVDGENFSYENVLVTKPEPSTPPTPPDTPDIPGTPPGTPHTPGETPSTTPGKPSDEPGNPPGREDNSGGSSDQGSGDKGHDQKQGALAMTGANIIWAVVLGVLLIFFGTVLLRRRKNEK